MKVKNMINNQGNTAPNQFIIQYENTITFQSYDSRICDWDGKQLKLYKNWDYSKTTMRYFKEFLKTYTNVSYESKAKFLKNLNNLVESNKIELMY